MSKTARLYQDTRAANAGSSLDRLNDDLQDVTRIMTKNMEELLWRGDSLDRKCSDVVSRRDGSYNGLSRDVAFINFSSLGVRKVPQGSTQHQFQCDDAAVCSLRCYTFYYNHSPMVEVYMTFRVDLSVHISHVYSCSRAENHF
jgi:hypothetical protein